MKPIKKRQSKKGRERDAFAFVSTKFQMYPDPNNQRERRRDRRRLSR